MLCWEIEEERQRSSSSSFVCCCVTLLTVPVVPLPCCCMRRVQSTLSPASLLLLRGCSWTASPSTTSCSLFSSSLRVFSVNSSKTEKKTTMAEETHLSEKDLLENLFIVKDRIRRCEEERNISIGSTRLVAVSKTKPKEYIQTLYDAGHRHFGENYFQELVEKAAALPSDICWHFIGHLQSQKAKGICRDVPNLFVLETVDSIKLADKLNAARSSLDLLPLNIFIQINTSAETSKSGILFNEDIGPILTHIKENCPLLRITGLMTIGEPGNLECFGRLVECRDTAAAVLEVDPNDLELSMGMSGDFEEAIAAGSTSVRVGSTIFGARSYAK